MSQVFSLLKLGKPVPEATIHAIEGYRDQLNELQAKLDAEGRPYEVRFKNGCYVLERLTHKEAVEADIAMLQQYVPQGDLFTQDKQARLRAAADKVRSELAAKGLVKPKETDENLH